jgi:hypothetical protein
LHRFGLLQLVFRALGLSRLCGLKLRPECCKGNNAGAKDGYRSDQNPDLWFALAHRCKLFFHSLLCLLAYHREIPDLKRLPVLSGNRRNSPDVRG